MSEKWFLEKHVRGYRGDETWIHTSSYEIYLGQTDQMDENQMRCGNLIAAAPDLLEALERTNQTLNNLAVVFSMSNDVRRILGNEVENIRLAIAKAKGEQK